MIRSIQSSFRSSSISVSSLNEVASSFDLVADKQDSLLYGRKRSKLKKRFLIVDSVSCSLYVFSLDDGLSKVQREEIIPLSSCTVSPVLTEDFRPYFSLTTKTKDLIYFGGRPDDELQEWARMFSSYSNRIPASSLSKDKDHPTGPGVGVASNSSTSTSASASISVSSASSNVPSPSLSLKNSSPGLSKDKDKDKDKDKEKEKDGVSSSTSLLSGWLQVRSDGTKWKRRWVTVGEKNLSIFTSDSRLDQPLDTVQLMLCSSKIVPQSSMSFAFDLFANQKTINFSASSEAEQSEWVSIIQSISKYLMLAQLGQSPVSAGLTGGDSGNNSQSGRGVRQKNDTKPRALQKEVEELMTREGNDVCADCGDPNPVWCVVNIGCFICIHCSGIHRNLGTHISKVRSVTLDDLLPEHVEMLKRGNLKVNEEFEYAFHHGSGGGSQSSVFGFAKPVPSSPRAVREAYIAAKYEERLFHVDTVKNSNLDDLLLSGNEDSLADVFGFLLKNDEEFSLVIRDAILNHIEHNGGGRK